MRYHILGLPHTVTSKDFSACAYTQKVVKFGKMMTELGHEVLHYGHEDSDLQCTEHITVLTNADFMESYGSHDWRKTFFKFDTSDLAYRKFYDNAIREVGKRKRQHDFILPFWGAGVRPVCDAHPDIICVEPGIGYAGGHWARWKVFESYAIYHAYCGLGNVGTCRQDWYEVVIPNYFDTQDFDYRDNDEKEDYFLYLGRVYSGKGVEVAIQATQRAGVKLVIAGQKEEGYKLPSHVEYVGYADTAKRKELMSKARGSILASMYVEPFGGVQIENLLSGTPTLTTDWGSFSENNLHGYTGYRCRTMGDFVTGIERIMEGAIRSWDCRTWGENFSLTNIAPMYEKYFRDVLAVYTGEGWYSPSNGIDAMFRRYP
jgi:glycosyltransferase involved in cell wall biosynthesis